VTPILSAPKKPELFQESSRAFIKSSVNIEGDQSGHLDENESKDDCLNNAFLPASEIESSNNYDGKQLNVDCTQDITNIEISITEIASSNRHEDNETKLKEVLEADSNLTIPEIVTDSNLANNDKRYDEISALDENEETKNYFQSSILDLSKYSNDEDAADAVSKDTGYVFSFNDILYGMPDQKRKCDIDSEEETSLLYKARLWYAPAAGNVLLIWFVSEKPRLILTGEIMDTRSYTVLSKSGYINNDLCRDSNESRETVQGQISSV
jgi:hypothetical protein